MNRLTIQRKCPQCAYCVEDPNVLPQQVLIGQQRYICLRRSPSSATFPSQQGLVSITSYPAITKDSISCGDFEAAATIGV